MSKSILDPSFKYRSSNTHRDSTSFAKRQAARARIAKMSQAPKVEEAPNVVYHAWTPGRKTYEGKK